MKAEIRQLIVGTSEFKPPYSLLIFAFAILGCRSSGAIASDPLSPTTIFAPAGTSAQSIFDLSLFVLAVTGAIFVIVFTLLAYSVIKFRRRADDDDREPTQVYGSNQIELAWTIVPTLIVIALFMATGRVIANVQKPVLAGNVVEVTAIGHQYWWEYRYPGLNVVTANELHVPLSDASRPMPTVIKLLSADTDHSFWIPRLAGKTDLIPNHPNSMWIDPREPGVYIGQCAQYCGTQHAKMLLRVYVETPEAFDRWIRAQSQPAKVSDTISEGRELFETTACINCHTIQGTVADGRFGPDLTHLMSRETIAAGAATNNPQNLRLWIKDPDAIKPGSKMPAMQLSDRQIEAVASYLETLN